MSADRPDHSLTLGGPYEPDWWCLPHSTSGTTGTTCPQCDTTAQRIETAQQNLATAQARLLLLGEAPEAQRQSLIQAIHDAQHALDTLTGQH